MALEVLEESSTAAHHPQQPMAGVEVLFVSLKVRGELTDPRRQQRDLHLGRSCVGFVLAKFLNHGIRDNCRHISAIVYALGR